jgi:co-chaperonin GroES (HSP10)
VRAHAFVKDSHFVERVGHRRVKGLVDRVLVNAHGGNERTEEVSGFVVPSRSPRTGRTGDVHELVRVANLDGAVTKRAIDVDDRRTQRRVGGHRGRDDGPDDVDASLFELVSLGGAADEWPGELLEVIAEIS